VGSEAAIVAAGEGWTLEVDPAEWEGLSLAERTRRIAEAWLAYEMAGRHSPAGAGQGGRPLRGVSELLDRVSPAARREIEEAELAHIFAGVSEEGLLPVMHHAWRSLPGYDRDVLRALGLTVETGPLPADRRGQCRVLAWQRTTARHPQPSLTEGDLPMLRVAVDPAQGGPVLLTLLHELAHGAYRHAEVAEADRDRYDVAAVMRAHEEHADVMAGIWLRLLAGAT
jgi:hypothetical protein